MAILADVINFGMNHASQDHSLGLQRATTVLRSDPYKFKFIHIKTHIGHHRYVERCCQSGLVDTCFLGSYVGGDVLLHHVHCLPQTLHLLTESFRDDKLKLRVRQDIWVFVDFLQYTKMWCDQFDASYRKSLWPFYMHYTITQIILASEQYNRIIDYFYTDTIQKHLLRTTAV